MTEMDRQTLFANEAFAIGMLQAVSGGAVIAAIAQAKTLIELVGKIPFLVFFTAVSFTLVFAVLAAYWRHQYKMWHVKKEDSLEKQEEAMANEREANAGRDLEKMRFAMCASVSTLVFGILALMFFVWIGVLCDGHAA